MLNKKQQKILVAVFDRPTRANIAWADVEKLVIALGGEIQNKGGSVVCILLRDQPRIFHRPHPQKEASKPAIEAMRKFLTNLGFMP